MLVQLADRRRLTVFVDVGRRRIDVEMHREELALDQIWLQRLAQPDRAISLAHGQVQFLIGQDELEVDLRIELEEFGNALRQPPGAEPYGGGDAQQARRSVLGLGQPHLDAFELHQHVVRGSVEHLALFRQHKAASMPVEQRHADLLLERAHLPRDGRLRQVQRIGGMRERAGLRRRVKHTKLVPVQ